jgi:DNA transformation protein and related proteins
MNGSACGRKKKEKKAPEMARQSEFTDHVMDLLAPIPSLGKRSMFGGVGISADTVQFAMIIGDTLYFVVDETTRPKYEEMGSACFSYQTRKKKVDVRRYYEVPVELLDDQERLLELAEESVTISKKNFTTKNTKSTKKDDKR